MKFGLWTVLHKDTDSKSKDIRWICRCECGNEKSVLGKYLIHGKSKSCGCQKIGIRNEEKWKAQVGRINGKLKIIGYIYEPGTKPQVHYICNCECGNEVLLTKKAFDSKTDCGCAKKDLVQSGKIISEASARICRNMFGKKFGKLTVVEMIPVYHKGMHCKCKCDCGNEIIVKAASIMDGATRSCGCIKTPNLVGSIFGRLTVIERCLDYRDKPMWKCQCGCGQYVMVSTYGLTKRGTKSCGCIRNEKVSTGENLLISMLNEYNIAYKYDYGFADCKGVKGKKLRFDFYLFDYNTIIEYDGAQHFRPIEYFGGKEAFDTLTKNDAIKNDYCKTHSIILVRIPYTSTKEEISKIIQNIITDPVTTTAV